MNVESAPLVEKARTRAKEIIIEAKDQSLSIRTSAEDEARKIKETALEFEKKYAEQKADLAAQMRELAQKAKDVKAAKEKIDLKTEEVEELLKRRKGELEKIASLSKDEARDLLMRQLDKELAEEKGKKIRHMEEEIKKEESKLSQEILVSAMRFGATDLVVEYTTSKVKLPDEELKGRIIGKEGRNIRTFEELTGVDLDLDSSPGEIIVSCFDTVRREVARLALERLVADGRIQPARIEEVVNKAKSEIDQIMFKAGDDLCHKLGVYDLAKDLVQMLGRFKYRFSYGQNMIEHTLEEARIGVAIAREVNADVEAVRLGCLFHDIGKVVTEDEGTHVQLGVDLLTKHKMSQKVIDCVAEHHEDKPFSHVESAIVNLADHVSGARPGARSEDYESYVKRLKDLEAAALSFDGVDKVFAVSAGREVRVFVSPEKVDDYSTAYLAREIAKKIELEQTYPGVVKVIVIRETRVVETAK
ncbi:ribonuclease Y [candidate division WWE3 bacterium RIFOXYC1_FULL_40_10]|uniref:Ribonuclease Y n=1 Tax=candidate division WWE3 bacterium RIFOXYA2_FULL_46_9 TaxID=1802636 RepID=A0A1F4VYR0_UNCKA|nr:MAG: ribonuclease Y [candidate division WWE3 bacterium RIFOXYB1_FULL_40_22]OGC62201.1 MAG: ribonuclease Y [candidate division WWE3 bacterium RIFOXYA1_FULL_40_11]OGC62302.1 MAG: ribonuclease Y [candidate division WWE3 bacterium RIFOXYA2_FULL_46_9]OGC65104.1 MAG: ribonuclease Y [candidate division WWE3 bacterium RIFOXYB2_FULL_41_6]OGC66584.1 MAG: ribonuclease Y [candidate division WWE3 bacterium RIFOXYC1_FULL_40_10]OGC68023.1 MAG: ribonuclease Y [candidate division WWE3 bacterium RIFOXYC2_FUL